MKNFIKFVFLPASLLSLIACGGGGGGGGSGIAPKALSGVSVSGTAKNITDPAQPSIDGAVVEVKADLDGDGGYGSGEVFSTSTNSSGFFSVNIADATKIAALSVAVRKAGYSDYVKTFENVSSSLSLAAPMSEGGFSEIDVSGISSSPARAGRIALSGGDTVTLRLYDRVGNMPRSGRISLGRFSGNSYDNKGLLVEASFPVRGLMLPAGSTKMYANVAYLDTATDTETMPGGFRAEGGEGSPYSMLKTFGASQINLLDQNGKKLLDDPLDRSTNVKIKIAVPAGTYQSLFDEVPETEDVIDVPFFYYDEMARTWKLHANADGSPKYARLEDNFGNVLNSADLEMLKKFVEDASGNQIPSYAPAGASPSEVTIYSVGEVHHFTTYNSDVRGRANSNTYQITDKNGKVLKNINTKYTKKNGSKNSDRGSGGSKQTISAYTPEQIQSALSKILSDDPEVRKQWLDWVKQKNDPVLLQAIVNGLRDYATRKREDWQGNQDELASGINAIFNNKWITDAIINTSGVDDNSLDCSKTPDLCRGIVTTASEEISKSSDAKKAVALLMTIAVEAYNPSNLNLEYAMDKGVAMVDLAIKAGDNKRLKQVAEYFQKAKDAADLVKQLKQDVTSVGGVWPPPYGSANWSKYSTYVYDFQDAMDSTKHLAAVVGEKLSRMQLTRIAQSRTKRFAAAAATEAELAEQEKEALLNYKEIGGLLFGSNRFEEFKWGYWTGDTFVETQKPAGVDGGTEVGVIEYFDGEKWVPLPGRSSLGVDAEFVPVPKAYSYGDGTKENPAAYLGSWTLDVLPTVKFSGKLVHTSGSSFTNADKLKVFVNGQGFACGSNGAFSGEVEATGNDVYVSAPGISKYYTPSGAVLDMGDMPIGDQLFFADDSVSQIAVNRNEPFSIDLKALSLSGSAVAYDLKLYGGPYYTSSIVTLSNTTGVFESTGIADQGWYYLEAKVSSTGLDGVMTLNKTFVITVKNQAPKVDAINLSNATPTAGDSFVVDLDLSDPDGLSDIKYTNISAWCLASDGWTIGLPINQGETSGGERTWTVSTDNYYIYTQPLDELSCTISASATDIGYMYATKELSFILAQNNASPTSQSYLQPEYKTTYFSIYPGWVNFSDINNDIVEYSVDCGKGQGAITSSTPIYDYDLTGDNSGCIYSPSETMQTYNFSASATDSKGNKTTFTTAVTVYAPIDLGVSSDLFPSPLPEDPPYKVETIALQKGNTAFTINITAYTSNGTLAEGSYTVNYQPNSYYWAWGKTIASGDIDTTSGTSSTAVTIDRPGHYSVWAKATDSAGLYSSIWKEFNVTSDFDFEMTINDQKTAAAWYYDNDIELGAQMVGTPVDFAPSYYWEVAPASTGVYSYAGNEATLTYGALNPLTPEGKYLVRLTVSNTNDTNSAPVVHEVELTAYSRLDPIISSPYAYYQDPADLAFVVAVGNAYEVNLGIGTANLVNSYWMVQMADGSSAEGKFTVTGSLVDTRSYVFTEAGQYAITVTAVDDRGMTETKSSGTITVRTYPPVVDSLSASSTSPSPGTKVTFTSTSHDPDGSVNNYIWNISGSYLNASGQTVVVNETVVQNTSNTADPSAFDYTFTQVGNYTAKLVVEDNSGRKSEAKTASITVAYKPPVITSLTASPTSGAKPLNVTFTAIASDPDGTIAKYEWDAGADGIIDQTGSASFSKTYTTAGTFTVKLTVTDSQGKTATKNVSVTVYDAAQGVSFKFRELRADGLGPDMTFDYSDPHSSEMQGYFAKIGTASPIYPDESNTFQLSATMAGAIGFNGFDSQSWGNVSTSLFYITAPGTYEVGLIPGNSYDNPPILLDLQGGYNCMQANSGDYTVALNSTGSGFEFRPSSETVMIDGTINILAAVGNKADDYSPCDYTAYAYMASQPSTSGGSLGSSALQMFSISHPNNPATNNWSFSRLDIEIEGLLYGMWESYTNYTFMPKNTTGRKLFPIVAGADYFFEFTDLGNPGFTYKIKKPASEFSGSMAESPYPFTSTGFGQSTLNLTNPQAGTIEVCRNTSTVSACSSTTVDTATSSIAIPTLTGANGAVVKFTATDESERSATYSTLGSSLDVSQIGSNAGVSNVSLDVDTTAETMALDFDTTGDICIVMLTASLDDGTGVLHTRDYGLVTTPASLPLVFKYPIPEMASPFDPLFIYPASSILKNASGQVACISSTADYQTFLTDILKHLSSSRFSIFDAGGGTYISDMDSVMIPAWTSP